MSWSSQFEGNCLTTTTGKITFLQSRSNKLYVRPCYPELFEVCRTRWAGGRQGIFVLGTPGIGKSCFLDYALHRCLYDADGQNVLYLHGPRERAYLFRRVKHGDTIIVTVTEHSLGAFLDGSVTMSPDSYDVVLYDPHGSAERTNAVHISHFDEKKFIVPISPDTENCKKLRKDTRAKSKVYMGPLSSDEAEDMRSSCFPDVSTALLQTRFSIIGGIARFLCEAPPLANDEIDETVKEVKEKQQTALNDILQNPLRIDAGEVEAQFKVFGPYIIYDLSYVTMTPLILQRIYDRTCL